jgi:hypothetical protein
MSRSSTHFLLPDAISLSRRLAAAVLHVKHELLGVIECSGTSSTPDHRRGIRRLQIGRDLLADLESKPYETSSTQIFR